MSSHNENPTLKRHHIRGLLHCLRGLQGAQSTECRGVLEGLLTLARNGTATRVRLTALETRSTARIEEDLASVKGCVTWFIRPQAASMKALSGLLND